MYRMIQTAVTICLLLMMGSSEAKGAWPWQDKNLVTINGLSYTEEDYKNWWNNWREPSIQVPESLQEFIEWKLLAREAATMELYNEESYKHKLEVYLKVRTRMQFKYEEVDSKVVVTDEEIRSRYEEKFTPVTFVTVLYFATGEEAAKAYQGLQNNEFSYAELLQKTVPEGGARKVKKSKILPKDVPGNKELAALEAIEVGDVSEPQASKHYAFLLHLDERKAAEPNDFQRRRGDIQRSIAKEKESKLTAELLDRLWSKYEVQINEELLETIDIKLTGDVLNQSIVTTNKENIPLYILVNDLRKEYKMRRFDTASDAVREELSRGLLNGMIADYLISWESAERRYEEKPPLQVSYEFYKENRLIKELERVLIAPQVKVSDAAIEEYYQKNLDDYLTIGLVSYTIIKDDKDLVEKVWREINLGQDFSIAAKKFNAKLVPMRDKQYENIAPEAFREAIQGLKVGEVSQPLAIDDKFVIAKVVDHKEPEPVPLSEVKQKITAKLHREEFVRLRSVYLARLLEGSDISINKNAWQKLRSGLQNEKS